MHQEGWAEDRERHYPKDDPFLQAILARDDAIFDAMFGDHETSQDFQTMITEMNAFEVETLERWAAL